MKKTKEYLQKPKSTPKSDKTLMLMLGNIYAYTYIHTYTYIYICVCVCIYPPAMQETPVRSLGWEDPLEKAKATHSSILAWRIPWIV